MGEKGEKKGGKGEGKGEEGKGDATLFCVRPVSAK